jgi:hypothetical protein
MMRAEECRSFHRKACLSAVTVSSTNTALTAVGVAVECGWWTKRASVCLTETFIYSDALLQERNFLVLGCNPYFLFVKHSVKVCFGKPTVVRHCVT